LENGLNRVFGWELDYDPFGMMMVGRNWSVGSECRYGFNGMENVDEIAGNDNSLDFGARIYDSRLGKWLSVDPMLKKYPHLSPFVAMGNSPILIIDYDGRDIVIYYEDGNKKVAVFTVITNLEVEIILNNEILPDLAKDAFGSQNWKGPVFKGPKLNNLNKNLWGDFKSDAKMITLGASATAVLSGVIELDIVTINPNYESSDAGKTFAYITVGAGFGLAKENIAGKPSWDVGLLKGNVDFTEDHPIAENDRYAYQGIAFEKNASALLWEKGWVTAYGCFEDCLDCMGNCDDEPIYSAELKGISLSDVKKQTPSVSGQTLVTNSWLIGEIKFLESQETVKQDK